VFRIGVLGIAHTHGYSYIRQIQSFSGMTVTGVFDHDPGRTKKASELFGIRAFEEPLELIENSDAVVVTSENSFHRHYAELAMSKGRHILCEKPIATNEEDARSMLQTARENNVVFQMAFPVRYAPSIQQAKNEIQTGKLGRVLSVSATNHGRMPGGWFIDEKLSGGGAVMDHTVHVVDIIRWLLDVEIVEVSAEYGRLIYDIPVEDCGLLLLSLSNDSFMSLDCSWSRPEAYPYWGDVTLNLVGTEGTLRISAFDAKLKVFSNKRGVFWENFGESFDRALVKEFADSVMEKRKPLTSGEDGLEALRVALAAYESGRIHEPVHLNH